LTKILYIPTRYFPSISGAEFYIQSIAEILSKDYNYHIDIFTSNAIDFKALRDPKGKTIQINDKHYNYVNNLKIKRFPIDYSYILKEKLEIIKKIDDYKPLNISDECLIRFLKNGPFLIDLYKSFLDSPKDQYNLIHTTFFPYFNLILALMIGNLIKKPTICTPFFHFSNPRYLDGPLKELLKKFDLLIACTNLEKKILIEKVLVPQKKIEVIPMGVDYNKFKYLQNNIYLDYSFKKKFFRDKEIKYKMVLFCGYKNYEKGAISILKAIPHIIRRYRRVYFVFIGPSTKAYNIELRKLLLDKNVRIINFTPDNLNGYFDKKKIVAFRDADLYLMPSRSDAYGIAFLEAWASHKPVIGANIGATPEVIRNNTDGLLVKFDNPKDIADKVVFLLKKPPIRKRFGIAGEEKIIKHNTWNIIANKTNMIYQELIKNHE